MSLQPTRDFAAEEKRLKRQQALAQMLMQQGSTPMETSQMAGGMVVPISPMQGMANAGQQIAAALMMRAADKKETALVSDKNKALAAWLGGMPNDPTKMAEWASQGNTLSPEISGKVVGSMVDNALKPEEFGKEAQWGVNPETKAPFAYVLGSKGTKKVLDGVLPRDKRENINGIWVDPYAPAPGDVAPQNLNDMVIRDATGKPVVNAPLVGAKTQVAAAGATRVNTNILPNTVQAEMGKAAIGDLSDRRVMAQTAAGAVNTAYRIMEAIDTGKVMTGPGTGAILALSRYFNVPGTDKDKIKATQQMVADLAAQTLAAKDKLGGGVLSDNDIAFLKQVSGGDPNLNGAAIRRIAEISAKSSMALIETFNRDVSSTQQYLGQPLPYDYSVAMPQPYKRPTTPGPEAAGAADMKAKIAAERARRARERGRK